MIYTQQMDVYAIDGGGARNVQDDTINIGLYTFGQIALPPREDAVPRHGLLIKNIGDSTFYLGQGNVSEENGYALPPGEQLQLRLQTWLYVVCGPGDSSNAQVMIILD